MIKQGESKKVAREGRGETKDKKHEDPKKRRTERRVERENE